MTLKQTHKFIEKTYYKHGTTKLAKSEINDCSVYAMMHVLNTTYNRAHAILKTLGRKDRFGLQMPEVLKFFKESTLTIGGYQFCPVLVAEFIFRKDAFTVDYDPHRPMKGMIGIKKLTINEFIKKFPDGVYFVLIEKHALCIRDGVVFDGLANAGTYGNTKVIGALKVTTS